MNCRAPSRKHVPTDRLVVGADLLIFHPREVRVLRACLGRPQKSAREIWRIFKDEMTYSSVTKIVRKLSAWQCLVRYQELITVSPLGEWVVVVFDQSGQ